MKKCIVILAFLSGCKSKQLAVKTAATDSSSITSVIWTKVVGGQNEKQSKADLEDQIKELGYNPQMDSTVLYNIAQSYKITENFNYSGKKHIKLRCKTIGLEFYYDMALQYEQEEHIYFSAYGADGKEIAGNWPESRDWQRVSPNTLEKLKQLCRKL